MYRNEELKKIIGAKVSKIFINSDYLKFETDKGNFCFNVYGDCCSISYFYDFIGVERVLNNGPIISFEEIPNMPQPLQEINGYDATRAYGYRIITQDKEHGEVSSVLSFRNDSNGYYGGSMGVCENVPDKVPEIKSDWTYNPLDIKQ